MKRSTVFLWATGYLVGALLIAASPATAIGYPVYTGGSFAIEKFGLEPLVTSEPVDMPLGVNFGLVKSEVGVFVLPGSTGRVGVNQLGGDMVVVGGLSIRTPGSVSSTSTTSPTVEACRTTSYSSKGFTGR